MNCTPVKIAIIGAGSASFAGSVVRDLCGNPGLHGSHIALMDVDQRRLDLVIRLGQRLSEELKAGLTFSQTTDRVIALQGADFVINTAQVGGHSWTEAQRSLAEEHGYYRGARLHDLGQMAFFLDVARDIERICPDAWLLQVSNPVFEGCTTMIRETGVKVVGLCHGHTGYREIAKTIGLDPDRTTAQTPGFNHWIWMTDFRCDGKDAYPLLDEWIATKADAYFAENPDCGPHWVHQYHLFGLVPIGDTPRFAGWWYHTDLATKQHWYGQKGGMDSEIAWSEYLERVAAGFAKVEAAALDESKPVSDTFPPAVSSGIPSVAIIDALVNDVQGVYQVNIPNRGPLIQGFPQDLVVEVQGVVSGAGVRGVAVPALPPRLMVGAMIPRWHRAELAVEAVRQGDRGLALLYLLYDQRTRSLAQAEALLDEWLADPRNKRVRELFHC